MMKLLVPLIHSNPPGPRCHLQVLDHVLGPRSVWVNEQGDHPGLGNQLGQKLETLGHQLAAEIADAGYVAVRRSKAGDEAELDRHAAGEHDRIVVVASFAQQYSIDTFWPSTQPRSLSPWRNAAT
jgi:hypothetical protein